MWNLTTENIKEQFSVRRFLVNIRTHQRASIETIFRLLDGKSVSLVGNARRLADEAKGGDIDQSDIVLRFNQCPMPSISSHGERTDWIATSVPISQDFFHQLDAKTLLWMSPKRRKIPLWIAGDERCHIFERSTIEHLLPAMMMRPTTGLMTILMLSQTQVKNVRLFGFDFYDSLSLSGDQTKAGTPHHYDLEKDIITEIVKCDRRIELC